MTTVDVAAAERAVIDLLLAIGEDPASPELQETPGRVARTLADLLTPLPVPVPVHVADDPYDDLVVVRDLGFRSVCADHLAPFGGVVHVAYVRGSVAVDAARVARVVDWCTRRLQTPVRLPGAIITELERELLPSALGVAVEITRTCPDLANDELPASTRTAAYRGALRDDTRARAEFLRLTSTARGTARAGR
jgi:GTP cyclohydrolase I